MESAISNRRRCVRQRIHSPAFVSTTGDSAETLLELNELFDISIRGASFQSQARFQTGQSVSLRLELSETGDSIQTAGRVTWTDLSGRTGVRFRKMPRSCFRRLKEWLFLNAIAACVQYEAAQGRLTPSELPPQIEAVWSASSNAWRNGLQTPDSNVYATILITLAAIKKDVEACGESTQAALQRLMEHARTAVCASGAAIAVSNGDEMICRASIGSDVPSLGARIAAGNGFSGECIRRGRLLRCDDSESDSRVDRESCRVLGVRSIMAVPVRFGDTVIALLEVFSPQAEAFRWKDEVYLRGLAEIALTTLRRAIRAAGAVKISTLTANEPSIETDLLGFGLANPASGQPAEMEPGGFDPAGFSPDSDAVAGSSSYLRGVTLVAVVAVIVLAALLFIPFLRKRADVAQDSDRRSASATVASRTRRQASTPADELEQLRQQAEQGDAAAQFSLGARYATGEGVPQDYIEAVRWFSLAAGEGHVTAQATLGAYYWLGRGVPQDFDKAYFWSVLARAGGDEASKYRIPALASHLSREEIIADQEQANDWIKQHQLASQNSRTGSGNSKD